MKSINTILKFFSIALMLNLFAFAQANGQCTENWNFFGSRTTTVDFALSGEDASCPSVSDGALTVVGDYATSGTNRPRNVSTTYLWDDNSTEATRSGLTNGVTYSVTITSTWNRLFGSTNTCVLVKSGSVGAGGCCLSASLEVKNNCSTPGAARVTVNNGTAPYTYIWSTGASTSATSATNNSISGLGSGSYSVTVIDANCQRVENFAVSTSTDPTVTASVLANPSCYGGSDGSAISASVKLAFSSASHTFEWTGPNGFSETNVNGSFFGISSDQIDDLFSGLYSVTVTDQDGCTGSATVTLTDPAPLSSTESITPASCFGDENGSIQSSASGGTTSSGDYGFEWSTSYTSVGASSTISDLGAGIYSLTITDDNDCTYETSAEIEEPDTMIVYAEVSAFGTTNNISVRGGNNGWIKTFVTGGNGSNSFSWVGPGSPAGQNPSYLSAGRYVVTVTDSKGCEAVGGVYYLVEP